MSSSTNNTEVITHRLYTSSSVEEFDAFLEAMSLGRVSDEDIRQFDMDFLILFEDMGAAKRNKVLASAIKHGNSDLAERLEFELGASIETNENPWTKAWRNASC